MVLQHLAAVIATLTRGCTPRHQDEGPRPQLLVSIAVSYQEQNNPTFIRSYKEYK